MMNGRLRNLPQVTPCSKKEKEERIESSLAEALPPQEFRLKRRISTRWPSWLNDIVGYVIKDWKSLRANTFETPTFRQILVCSQPGWTTVREETFAKYTVRTAFERPLLSSVAYVQRILHSEREEFERQHGWTIRTMEKDPSPTRDEYAPMIFSQETISYIESLDMMSGEDDHENILRARATAKAVLTRPFRLLNSHLKVVLTLPVYNYNLPSNLTVKDHIEATGGYLGRAFDVESLIENLLGQLAGNQAIVINVYDVTNSSDPLSMYGYESQEGDMYLNNVSRLDFGDPSIKHEMICRFGLSCSTGKNPPVEMLSCSHARCCFILGVALLEVKTNLNDSKNFLSCWKGSDESPCKWTGISCSPQDQRVIAILESLYPQALGSLIDYKDYHFIRIAFVDSFQMDCKVF